MFSFSVIQKYEKVQHAILSKNNQNSLGDYINKSVEDRALLLAFLKYYCRFLNKNTHGKFAKSLIKKIEFTDTKIEEIFKSISDYLQLNAILMRGEFFSLLLLFLRQYPKYIYNIQPDTKGIYALFLLGIFAPKKAFFMEVENNVRNMTDDKYTWGLQFFREIIPYLSPVLLKELIEGCFQKSWLHMELRIGKAPLLNFVITNSEVPGHLYKKSLRVLKNKIIDWNFIHGATYKIFPRHTLQGMVKPYEHRLNAILMNGNYEWLRGWKESESLTEIVPVFFQVLPQKKQDKIFSNFVLQIDKDKHNQNIIIIYALLIIQYLLPRYEKEISKKMKMILERNDLNKSVRSILSFNSVFALKKNKQRSTIYNAIMLPDDLIDIVSDYLLPDFIEQYNVPDLFIPCMFDDVIKQSTLIENIKLIDIIFSYIGANLEYDEEQKNIQSSSSIILNQLQINESLVSAPISTVSQSNEALTVPDFKVTRYSVAQPLFSSAERKSSSNVRDSVELQNEASEPERHMVIKRN